MIICFPIKFSTRLNIETSFLGSTKLVSGHSFVVGSFDSTKFCHKLHKSTHVFLWYSRYLLSWHQTILEARLQSSCINHILSDPALIISVVAQSSVLGSLLIIFFIYDIFKHIFYGFSLVYIDDLKIVYCFKEQSTLIFADQMNSDVNNLFPFTLNWLLNG